MKLGCLLFLVTLGATFFFYHDLVTASSIEHTTWIPIAFSLCASLFVGNIFGLVLTLRQLRASLKPRSQWRDGSLVGISGKIRAIGDSVRAPFSGTNAVIVEYSAGRAPEESSRSNNQDYLGFLMAPCTVNHLQGPVRLTGFPILANVPKQTFNDQESYRRAAEYFATAAFKEKSSNPMKLVKELNKVLGDDDGIVQEDFCAKSAGIHLYDPDLFDEDDIDEPDSGEPAIARPPLDKVSAIAAAIAESDFVLEETIIPEDAEVAVFGTYRKQLESIDIGSGLSNLSHTIQLGALSKVSMKNVSKSLFLTLLFGFIFVAGNIYLAKQPGIDFSRVPAFLAR